MMIDDILYNLFQRDNTFIYGLADLNGLTRTKFDGYNYAVSIGKKPDDKIINKLSNGPTLEYYNYYNRINNGLKNKACEIKAELKKIAVGSIIIEPIVFLMHISAGKNVAN